MPFDREGPEPVEIFTSRDWRFLVRVFLWVCFNLSSKLFTLNRNQAVFLAEYAGLLMLGVLCGEDRGFAVAEGGLLFLLTGLS